MADYGISRALPAIALALLIAVASVATAAEPVNARLEEMRGKVAELRDDMRAIENERDPAQRQRMLARHMADMHEAMSLMQNDIMPDMKKRFSGSKMSAAQHAQGHGMSKNMDMEMESEAHLMHMETMMEATMVEMANLLNVMDDHRKAAQASP